MNLVLLMTIPVSYSTQTFSVVPLDKTENSHKSTTPNYYCNFENGLNSGSNSYPDDQIPWMQGKSKPTLLIVTFDLVEFQTFDRNTPELNPKIYGP